MPRSELEQSNAIRAVIADFLSERLSAKLEKLAEDDPKRIALREQFIPSVWLADAARRVGQIQAVTHSLKPIHPDARGSSLLREPSALKPLSEFGSHMLGTEYDVDVVGNAAALDVYKFLKLEHEGRSLLSLAMEADADFGAALSDDPALARVWMSAFAGLVEASEEFSSHTRAKQIYWPVDMDLHDDSSYHLLAPLYPTSLVHRFYLTLQDDRFSEAAKAARDARKTGEWHERPVREYPNLAIQKLGGTKPHNISQLNCERHGDNFLLASLPPVWQSPIVKPLFGVESLFKVFGWRRQVRALVGQLRQFLGSDPARNLETRMHRDELVEALLDEFLQFTAEMQTLDPGWTADAQCELTLTHCAWLDPDDIVAPPSDLIDSMASDFARWLNARLVEPLPMGDAEYLHWRKQARDLFKQEEREGSL